MMDECLSSDTEMGGVGSDNMTILIVGILRGQSFENWWKAIQSRVHREGLTPNSNPRKEIGGSLGRTTSSSSTSEESSGTNSSEIGKLSPTGLL